MIWLDIETRGPLDVSRHGGHAHAAHPDLKIISIAYAFDDGPVQRWRGLFAEAIDEMDPEPAELYDRIEAGERLVVWNAAYERLVIDGPAGDHIDMPQLDVGQLVCAATWARYHNLPGDQKTASQWLLPTGEGKQANSKFRPLWDNANPLTEARRPVYELMLDYGDRDVESMREVCRYLSDFPGRLLEDYRVSEAINDRGIHASRRWIDHAVTLKPVIEAGINDDLRVLTAGKVETAKSSKAAHAWVLDQLTDYLDPDGFLTDESGAVIGHKRLSRVKRHRRLDGTGWWSESRPSLDREVRRTLRELLLPVDDDAPDLGVPPKLANHLLDVLDVLDDGAGAAASKYEAAQAMLEGVGDDRLRGLYILNGASQTGRFSSVRLQSHNFIRLPPPEDPGTVSAWMRNTPQRRLRGAVEERWKLSVHEVLGRMLRPTLQAPEGRALVWGDWSAIEARVCPWLSLPDYSAEIWLETLAEADRAAEAARVPDLQEKPVAAAVGLVEMFAAGEDVYLAAAKAITGRDIDRQDPTRQLGKVATLALGFGGGVGAYAAMARSYGVPPMDREKVKLIVSTWREANSWARHWWQDLDAASVNAMRNPGALYRAGKVFFKFEAGLLRGTLVMFLPDGRPLFYPAAEIRPVERFEDRWEDAIVFSHPRYGRTPLWYGQLAENATQGTAASLLREVLRDLEISPGPGMTIGHTHDEVLREVAEDDIDEGVAHLRRAMLDMPEWASGLPLAVDCHWGWSYGQDEGVPAD